MAIRYFRLYVTASVLAVFFSSCRAANEAASNSEVLDASSSADPFKESEEKLFSGNVVELHIHLHGDTFNKIVTHKNNGGHACDDDAPYGHVKELKYRNPKTGETVVINNAGMRVKGNTSCDDPTEQKNFKIKLNPLDKFIEDENGNEVWRIQNVYEEWGKRLNYPEPLQKQIKKQTLFGMKSFTIRRGGNDPTRMRDAISSDVFEYGGHLARKNGIAGAPEKGGPVFRGGMVWVRIHNGLGTILEGHYGIVEHVDDDMIEMKYGKKALSQLFKIKDAKGTFLDSDMPQNRDRLLTWYQPEVINGEGYTDNQEYYIKQKLCSQGKYKQSKCDELKKERENAEAVLRAFKKALNEATASSDVNERRKKLDELLDIDNILSYMAGVNLAGHWDSMIGAMANNDYLFHNGKSKKWGILVWDLDNSFGTGVKDYPWMASISDFGVNLKYRPLFKAVMDNFGKEYRQRVQDFMDGVYEHDSMGARITRVRDAVAPDSRDEKYENLYKFKNHRWGNAWCNLKNGDQSKVKISNGWPEIYKKNGKWVANCR